MLLRKASRGFTIGKYQGRIAKELRKWYTQRKGRKEESYDFKKSL